MTPTFQKLYCLPNYKIRGNTDMKHFVFCGKNGDWYFSKKNKDSEIELLQNVELTSQYDEKKYIDSDYDNYNNYRIGKPLTFLQYA